MNPQSENHGEPSSTAQQLPVPVETEADAARNASSPTSHEQKPTLKEQILTEIADENKEKISATNATKKDHLPALDDDNDVGVLKDQLVIRDTEADLTFTGTLL